MRPQLDLVAVDGSARAGVVTTPRGTFDTPCFMPVGTRGTVRLIDADDLQRVGAQFELSNTYHLMLRPGADRIAAAGGLHAFTGWSGHMLTDSGGFQVFSLNPKVDDDGATFQSTYDGTKVHLTPERAATIQHQIGADIQMVLDVCPALPAPRDRLVEAVDRTAHWAKRGRAAFEALDTRQQAQFGIVQGGIDAPLRLESVERTLEVGFDGYAVGGLSVGEEQSALFDTLGVTVPALPVDQIRYLMGVGDPVGLVEAIGLGVDLFDCVLPTRLARHGTALSWDGRLNLKAGRYADDDGPIDPSFDHPVSRWSRSYVRHLLNVDLVSGGRLLTLHNLAWLLALVRDARSAIIAGTFGEYRARVRARWDGEGR